MSPHARQFAADQDCGTHAPQAQPVPIRVKPVNLATGLIVRRGKELVPQIVGGVGREWADGDSGPGGRCSRCHACTAEGNWCFLISNREIPEATAWDFSPAREQASGCGRVGGPGDAGRRIVGE